MLEGKELEGKIGQDGSYSVDVSEKGVVLATVAFNVDKEVTPGLKVALTVSGNMEMKAATLVAAQAAKSNNKILQFIAKQLAKIDSGEEVHADLVAMADAHAAEESAPTAQA